jgi:hypothetical protein
MSRRPLTRASVLALVLALPFVACSSPEPPGDDGGMISGCKLAFVGDESAPMELFVTASNAGGVLSPLSEGASASIVFPPQGGRVVFAGVRVKNVDPCGVRLAGALRDPVSKQVRLDNRILNLKPSADGYAESDPMDISSFANIPVCPNQWSSQDLFDNPHELTVSLTDRDKRTATVVLSIVPRCDEEGLEAECRCICDADYVLGAACDDAGIVEMTDAGADSATDGGP